MLQCMPCSVSKEWRSALAYCESRSKWEMAFGGGLHLCPDKRSGEPVDDHRQVKLVATLHDRNHMYFVAIMY